MAEPKPFASLSSGLLARKGAARPAMRPQGFGQVGNGIEDLGWNDMGYEAPKPGDGPREATPGDFEQPPVYHPTGLTPVQSPVHDQQAELADRLGIDPEDEDFDETAELYDPNAVDETAEDEAEEFEGDELDQAPAFEAAPMELSEKPKKQPLQLSGGFDEPSDDVAAEEPFEATDGINGTSQPAAAEEPFELTERFDDFDPFQESEEVQDSAPPPPAAPVYGANSGFQPAAYTPVHQPTPRAAPGTKAKAAFTLRLDPERHLKLRLACAVNGRSAQQIVTDAVDRLLREMPELDAMAEKAKRRG
ncbi:MAG TPA: hypothetical protein VF757_08610 [Sphingomicrobium sp.]